MDSIQVIYNSAPDRASRFRHRSPLLYGTNRMPDANRAEHPCHPDKVPPVFPARAGRRQLHADIKQNSGAWYMAQISDDETDSP